MQGLNERDIVFGTTPHEQGSPFLGKCTLGSEGDFSKLSFLSILGQLWSGKLAAEEQVRLCICLLKATLTGIQKRTCAPEHWHTLLTCDLLTPDSLLLKSVKGHRSKTKVCRRPQ